MNVTAIRRTAHTQGRQGERSAGSVKRFKLTCERNGGGKEEQRWSVQKGRWGGGGEKEKKEAVQIGKNSRSEAVPWMQLTVF